MEHHRFTRNSTDGLASWAVTRYLNVFYVQQWHETECPDHHSVVEVFPFKPLDTLDRRAAFAMAKGNVHSRQQSYQDNGYLQDPLTQSEISDLLIAFEKNLVNDLENHQC